MSLKLKNGLNQMSDPNLSTRSSQILTGMTGNVNFPTPTPTLIVVQAAADSFSDALDKSSDRSSEAIAIKNQKRKELIAVLHLLGLYVLLVSNGNEAVAISSGFEISKKPVPTPPLTKPEAPVMLNGINPGELLFNGKPLAGAVSYLHQYATESMMSQGLWESKPCSKSSCVVTGLIPGTKYYCRIVAIGRKEQLVYSDIVSRIAA